MKFNSFLAFLFTLIAIVTIVAGVAITFSDVFFYRKDCKGYALLLFPDENEIDTLVGKGELVKIRAVNAGDFGDEYQVSLFGPEWSVVKPSSFTLKSEEAKTLFLYISPDLGSEGKYDLDVTVKSSCTSETTRIEVGVLPKEII